MSKNNLKKEKQALRDYSTGIRNGRKGVKNGVFEGWIGPGNHGTSKDYWDGYKHGEKDRKK